MAYTGWLLIVQIVKNNIMVKIGDLVFTLKDNKVLCFKVECLRTKETKEYKKVLVCGGSSYTNGTYQYNIPSELCFPTKDELLNSL